MDEDIDIEEHDVLDNPAIKHIFPDLTILKKEIDNPLSCEELPRAVVFDKEFTRQTLFNDFLSTSNDTNEWSSIKHDYTSNEGDTGQHFQNNIILGCRPTPKPKLENEHFELHIKPYLARVYLNDIKSYLRNCNMFCNKCQILFPHQNDYNAHKIKCYADNINIGIDGENKNKALSKKYKCLKCSTFFISEIALRTHLKLFHRFRGNMMKLIETKNIENLFVCFHCKKSFLSQKHLIEHIYKVLHSLNINQNDEIKLMEKQLEIINVNSEKHVKLIANTDSSVTKKFRRKIGPKVTTPQEKLDDNILLFRCYCCTYYFTNEKTYETHLIDKHKDFKFLIKKKVPFDPACKFCSNLSDGIILYNSHLQQNHEKEIENTFIIEPKICLTKVELLLGRKVFKNTVTKSIDTATVKNIPLCENDINTDITDEVDFHESVCNISKDSVINSKKMDKVGSSIAYKNRLVLRDDLFKCLKCDIHFLSATDAINHMSHVDMLIIWKCQICLKIFKKQDEYFHLVQHSLTQELRIHSFNESKLLRVLYSCTKCAIHFNDENYVQHFEICGYRVSESAYCTICDILISQELLDNHKKLHSSTVPDQDFVIINSDAILFDESGRPRKRCLTDKTRSYKRYSRKMNYCNTCQCFVSNIYLRNVHKNGNCKHMVRIICRECGLPLTAQSMKSHKIRHRIEKGLRLQNFRFYEFNNTKLIKPPIPTYPKCNYCNIHFISKSRVSKHICGDCTFLTCGLCKIKLCKEAYKLHMAFHTYTIGIKKGNKSSKIVNNHKNISNILKNKTSMQSSNLNLLDGKSDFDLYNIAYSCIHCHVVVDTFDKVIEHCRNHYYNLNYEVNLKYCEICKTKLDPKYPNDHLILHGSLKNTINKFIEYDAFYFGSNYKIFLKKLFEEVETEKANSILQRSIYRHEGRIKLNVFQRGSSNILVYKCNICNNYIDPDDIVHHAGKSCHRTQLFPCSVCGLRFISLKTQIQHEFVHKKYPTVSLKSFKIIIFNEEKDWTLNRKIINYRFHFILYCCRVCMSTFERFQSKSHSCNQTDLRKCIKCQLSFRSIDYKSHILKHDLICEYIPPNMKVVLFGQNNVADTKTPYLHCKFSSVVDYVFYICVSCKLCFKVNTNKDSFIHDCSDDKIKTPCPNCRLLIFHRHYNQHCKLHDIDPYFVYENFNFLPKNPAIVKHQNLNIYTALQNNNNTNKNDEVVNECKTIDKDMSNIKTNINIDKEKPQPVVEKLAKLYKCTCGLHFLSKITIMAHRRCNTKAAKQKCSKCSLVFTPQELFNHLIKHHGDEKSNFKFTIIELTNSRNELVDVYKCFTCDLHFVSILNAKIHYKSCPNIIVEKEVCKICDLAFDFTDLHLHEATHYKKNVADFEIIDLKLLSSENTQETREDVINNLVAEADKVTNVKYDISGKFCR